MVLLFKYQYEAIAGDRGSFFIDNSNIQSIRHSWVGLGAGSLMVLGGV